MSIRKAAIALSVLSLFAATVRAEDAAVGIDVSADFFGKYVWRGQNLNNSSVFQPSVGLTYGGFTGSIWGNLDLTNANDNSGEFSEWDFSLDYSAAVPGVEVLGFSVGAIHYHFPSIRPANTTELYWGLSLDAPLSPSVTVYHDIDEVCGTYVAFGLGHSIENIFELSPEMPVGMEIGASVGWGDSDYNAFYWGLDGSRLNDLTLSVSFPVEVLGWTVAPSVNYVTLLSDGIRATDAFAKKSDYVFAGINFSKSF